MVLGTPGELPKPPTEKVVFLEDMTDSQLADVVSTSNQVVVSRSDFDSCF